MPVAVERSKRPPERHRETGGLIPAARQRIAVVPACEPRRTVCPIRAVETDQERGISRAKKRRLTATRWRAILENRPRAGGRPGPRRHFASVPTADDRPRQETSKGPEGTGPRMPNGPSAHQTIRRTCNSCLRRDAAPIRSVLRTSDRRPRSSLRRQVASRLLKGRNGTPASPSRNDAHRQLLPAHVDMHSRTVSARRWWSALEWN